MAKVLMRVVEYWRADSESEAQEIISDAASRGGDLAKKTIELKTRKSKGQIIDENLKVTTQIDFCGQWPTEDEDE